jgi:hypothetical protein
MAWERGKPERKEREERDRWLLRDAEGEKE